VLLEVRFERDVTHSCTVRIFLMGIQVIKTEEKWGCKKKEV